MTQDECLNNEIDPSQNFMIKALTTSTQDILNEMALTPVSLKKVTPNKACTTSGDISAFLNITNNSEDGMIAASFPRDFAKLVIGRLIGVDTEELTDDDCRDGIGELVNMIAGKSKVELSHHATSTFRQSLPSIIDGQDHEINLTGRLKYMTLLFEAEEHNFYLQCSLAPFS